MPKQVYRNTPVTLSTRHRKFLEQSIAQGDIPNVDTGIAQALDLLMDKSLGTKLRVGDEALNSGNYINISDEDLEGYMNMLGQANPGLRRRR